MAVSLVPGLSVSGQISAAEVVELANAGFKTIICNRPDGEALDQPDAQTIAEAARARGLEFFYLPVVSGQMTEENVRHFGALLKEVDGPILAYCRSGMRSSALWALSQAGTRPADEIIGIAARAGYDLFPLASRLG